MANSLEKVGVEQLGLPSKTALDVPNNPATLDGSLPVALAFARKGYCILPYYKRTDNGACRCTLGKDCLHTSDPHSPISPNDATVDTGTITRWSVNHPESDLRLVFGYNSNLAVLTIDGNDDARDNLKSLHYQYGALPQTLQLNDIKGNTLRFFNLPDNFNDKEFLENIAAFSGIHLHAGKGSLILSELSCPNDSVNIENLIENAPIAEIPHWFLQLAKDGSANEVASFPCDVFPAPIADFIREGAESLSCPEDFLAVPALAVLGTAIGTSRQIEVKKQWRESPVFFTGVVAEPGSKKSPALKLVTNPLLRRQCRMREDYKQQQAQHEENSVRYQAELKRWNNDNTNTSPKHRQNQAPPPIKPAEPKRQQIVASDITIEALAPLLESNPRGILCIHDELSNLVRSMGQYGGGRGSDRNKWQSLWNSSPLTVNRKGEPNPIEVEIPFVSVTGCIQPDVLSELCDERGREDGFIHRLLLAIPDRKTYCWNEVSVTLETSESYERVIEALLNLKCVTETDTTICPIVVGFTDDARNAFVHWYDTHVAELQDDHFPENLRGPWAKLEGYAARFALTLQMARCAAGEVASEKVDLISVQGAVKLVNYFKSHIRRVYSTIRTDDIDKGISDLLRFVRKHGGKVTARQVQRSKVARIKNVLEVREIFEEASQRGYGKYALEAKNSLTFQLNSYSGKMN